MSIRILYKVGGPDATFSLVPAGSRYSYINLYMDPTYIHMCDPACYNEARTLTPYYITIVIHMDHILKEIV